MKIKNMYIHICTRCLQFVAQPLEIEKIWFCRIWNLYVPEIWYCEILGGSRMGDILGHSPGPRMQQTIQNNSGEFTCKLRAKMLKIKIKL